MEECTASRSWKQGFFFESVKNKAGARQAYHPNSTVKSYSRIKRPERAANQSPPFCGDRNLQFCKKTIKGVYFEQVLMYYTKFLDVLCSKLSVCF